MTYYTTSGRLCCTASSYQVPNQILVLHRNSQLMTRCGLIPLRHRIIKECIHQLWGVAEQLWASWASLCIPKLPWQLPDNHSDVVQYPGQCHVTLRSKMSGQPWPSLSSGKTMSARSQFGVVIQCSSVYVEKSALALTVQEVLNGGANANPIQIIGMQRLPPVNLSRSGWASKQPSKHQ